MGQRAIFLVQTHSGSMALMSQPAQVENGAGNPLLAACVSHLFSLYSSSGITIKNRFYSGGRQSVLFKITNQKLTQKSKA